MKSTLSISGAFLAASLLFSVNAHAQACETADASADSGAILTLSDICTFDGTNDVRARLTCGGELLYPRGGKDAQFTWTVPETGVWSLTSAATFKTILSVFEDASASCLATNLAVPTTCGANGAGNTTFAKGQVLLVTVDPATPTCGAVTVRADLHRGCVTNAINIQSFTGTTQVYSTRGKGTTRSTSCGNGVGLGANHSDEVFLWTAPTSDEYVFRATTVAGKGVTIAAFRDDCEGVELACSNTGLGAATGSSRIVTINAMEGKTYAILVRGREGDIDFKLDISKGGCSAREDLASRLGSDLVETRITNSEPVNSTVCNVATNGEDFYRWTAPYTGYYTFRTDAKVVEERVALAIRKDSCTGEEMACDVPLTSSHQANISSQFIEEGQTIYISAAGVGGGVFNNFDYTLSIYGLGCGDGFVGTRGASHLSEFNDGAKNTVDSEVCDVVAPVTETCANALPGGLFGELSCAESCGEFNTDNCARECPQEDTCEERAGSVRGCNSAGDCMYECSPGFIDCDGDLNAAQGAGSNGCEIALDDVENCGGCGQVCGDTQTCSPSAGGYACQGDTTCYEDGDGDTYAADGAVSVHVNGNCPAGTTPRTGDCDDNDPFVNPGMTESCNGIDDNCNGEVDESTPDAALCPAGPGAVGTCETNSGGGYECVFTCENGRTDTDGNVANGCEKGPGTGTPNPEPPVTPEPGTPPGGHSGGGVTLEPGVSMGGGRVWGTCASSDMAQGSLYGLLMLLGLVAVRRRREV